MALRCYWAIRKWRFSKTERYRKSYAFPRWWNGFDDMIVLSVEGHFDPTILTVALLVYSVESVTICRLLSVVCTERIVAKRRVLEQKLLLTAYRKSYIINRLVPTWMIYWPLFRGRMKVMSTIALHSTLNWISRKPLEIEAWFQRTTNRNDLWGIKGSCDRWCHVTLKCQTRDPNTLRVQYIDNGWR